MMYVRYTSCVQDLKQTLNVAIRTKESKESVKIEEFVSLLWKSKAEFSRGDVSLRIKIWEIFCIIQAGINIKVA